LFLQPEPYRQRRLIDAARLLPVFGTFLFVVPMVLLPKGEAGSTRDALIYIFLLWLLLIVFGALITRYIRRAERAVQTAHGGRRAEAAGRAARGSGGTPRDGGA
jgi:VIT1/CCC1 family predicted Fe2+/Mn2+ transporter